MVTFLPDTHHIFIHKANFSKPEFLMFAHSHFMICLINACNYSKWLMKLLHINVLVTDGR